MSVTGRLVLSVVLYTPVTVPYHSTSIPYTLIIRNFTLTVASCISVIMPGDFKVVCIKQVSHFNSVHINKVPLKLYILSMCRR